MGSYDLGAALFTKKFSRPIRMVRAPEPDKLTAEHVDLALQQTGSGALKIGYSTEGAGALVRSAECIAQRRNHFHPGRSRAGECRFVSRHAFWPQSTAANRTIRSRAGRGRADLSAFRSPLGLPKISNHRARAHRLHAQRSITRRRRCFGHGAVGACPGRDRQATLGSMVCIRADPNVNSRASLFLK